jgi:hypothetical protein
MDMSIRPFQFRLLVCAAGAAMFAAATADASPITYSVNEIIGGGSVLGQIQTDGTIGTLATANIVGWNLQLNGIGAATTLTSAGNQSSSYIAGNDLTATPSQLLFNFGGTGSFMLFQHNLFSGAQYYCVDNTSSVCYAGQAAVIPGSIADPSAQHVAMSGLVVIGTAGPSIDVLQNSVNNLADSRTSQIVGNDERNKLLLGQNEQVSCGNCGGADAGIGSFSLSAHGRYALDDEWTVMGGVDFGHYQQREALVHFTAGVAAAIQYDPADMGSSRPYAEAGLTASSQDTNYDRAYANGSNTAMGVGSAKGYGIGAFAEAGWVDRITPRDEAAAFLTYERNWQMVGSYAEAAGAGNPYSAAISSGTDIMDAAGIGAQFTHLLDRNIELSVNGSAQWAFNIESGLHANIAGNNLTAAQPEFVYYEVGGRVGYRVASDLTIDVYINGVLAPHAIGSHAHEGFGFRWTL